MFKFFGGRRPATEAKSVPADAPAAAPGAPPPVSGGDLHIPRAKISRGTLHLHYAINSLREELEAVDWYRQRAEDTDDEELKAILLHNAKEEVEHACMILEWIRRSEPIFDKELREYLFGEGPIVALEKRAMARD